MPCWVCFWRLKAILNLEKLEELGGAAGVQNHVRDLAVFCARQAENRKCECEQNVPDPLDGQ